MSNINNGENTPAHQQSQRELARNAFARDLIYAFFALYALYNETFGFDSATFVMANIAIVLPQAGAAYYELNNDKNRDVRKKIELVCLFVSAIDMLIIAISSKAIQAGAKYAIIAIVVTGLLSIVGSFRSIMALVSDIRNSEWGITWKSKEKKKEESLRSPEGK